MTPEEICSELSTLLEKANKEGPRGNFYFVLGHHSS